MNNYITDEELIKQARNGKDASREELFARYKPLAKKISRRYFLSGADEDDIFQEGMIGLFKGFTNYNLSTNSNFKKFAALCINRQIQTAIKNANRLKNKVLSEAISLNNQGGFEISETEEDDENIFYIIPSTSPSIDDSLISAENVHNMLKKIAEVLSVFEKKILGCYLDGFSYKQMAERFNKSTKSVENALTRIKIKLSFIKN